MPCNEYTKFRKVQHYGRPDLIEQIEVNLKHYIDWSLLQIGAWRNAASDASGVYGGEFNTLHEIVDSDYGPNRAYQAIRKDWIFETGVDYESPAVPISNINYNPAEQKNQVFTDYNHYFNSGDSIIIEENSTYDGSYTINGVSGAGSFYLNIGADSGNSAGGSVHGVYNPLVPTIYVSGIARSSNESGYEHTINYPLGQVVFESDQGESTISATYSFREVQTNISDDVPWFLEIQRDTFDPSQTHWAQNVDSGDFAVSASARIQLPAIIIEAAGRITSKPHEMGNLAAQYRPEFILHILSENGSERNNLLDIFMQQKDSTIWMYDEAKLNNYEVYSLDYRGSPTGYNYPDLVTNNLYRYHKLKFKDVSTAKKDTNNPLFHAGIVNITFEVIA